MIQTDEFELAWLVDGMGLLVRHGDQNWLSDPDGSLQVVKEIGELEKPASSTRLGQIELNEGKLLIEKAQISLPGQTVFEFHLLSNGADIYYSAFLEEGSRQVFRWTPGKESEQITVRKGLFRCLPNRDGESLALVYEELGSGESKLFRMDGPKMRRLF